MEEITAFRLSLEKSFICSVGSVEGGGKVLGAGAGECQGMELNIGKGQAEEDVVSYYTCHLAPIT